MNKIIQNGERGSFQGRFSRRRQEKLGSVAHKYINPVLKEGSTIFELCLKGT